MSANSNDDRPPLVLGMMWAYRVMSVGLEMALPAWLGSWLDKRWGTQPWMVTAGAVLGFTLGLMHLLSMVRPKDGRDQRGGSKVQSREH